jgi:N-glycosidase YbiA
MGQDRSLTTRADWNEVKTEVMTLAVRAKFEQNRALRAKLLATGTAELIHFSKSDAFWGSDKDGTDENRLGKILMALREELRTRG